MLSRIISFVKGAPAATVHEVPLRPLEPLVKDGQLNVSGAINATHGPVVEVGGPTPGGYEAVNVNDLDKSIFTSNLFPGMPVWGGGSARHESLGMRPFDGRIPHVEDGNPAAPFLDQARSRPPEHIAGTVDFQADVSHLPLQNEKVGALLVSCLNRDSRPDLLDEAMRVLEPGGVMVMQGSAPEDYANARAAGFAVLQHQGAIYPSLVLRKPTPDGQY